MPAHYVPLPPALPVGGRAELTRLACDGSTRSEIVIPLYMSDWARPVGVLDLDSTLLSTFDEQDRIGLENIVGLLSQACDWA